MADTRSRSKPAAPVQVEEGSYPPGNPAAKSPSAGNKQFSIDIPAISLPKGGGAIKGIEEKFEVNAVTGTMRFSIPVPLTPGRNGITPELALNYDSGNGNGQFGLGWGMDVSCISRKTEKGLPRYNDEEESDTFILSGTEDLVPLLEEGTNGWTKYSREQSENDINYTVTRYRPRIEGSFARIEKWKNSTTGELHWRATSRDNISSYYGLTRESRIADPADPAKIFSWLLCRTHDDKGNIAIYRYKQEDFANIPIRLSEKNRLQHCTQTYLKKVFYCNKTAFYSGDPVPSDEDFLFKVILDYGEHEDNSNPAADIHIEKKSWTCRKDPFSFCRAGFEVRTYRRCNRVLVFHCFEVPAELPLNPCLVRSLQLFYDDVLHLESNQQQIEGFSYLVKARQNAYRWDVEAGHYKSRSLPDFEFTYQQHEWNTIMQSVSPESILHAPGGIDDKHYIWVDLFSEGITGILTEQAGGWFYKSNLGNGNFSSARSVSPKPSFTGLSEGALQLQELEGNGIKYLVQYEGDPKGFFKLTEDEEWQEFKSFETIPAADLQNPDKQFIDLDGDGITDILVSDEQSLYWYRNTGEKGFEVSGKLAKELDEENGPAILFDDVNQSIFLADMNGDGLTDIVRIRNGDICYWPNSGYGKFGARLSMEDAPVFDHPDHFNPSLIRLADIDGSGTADIIYLGKNDFRVWMNLNGNAWSPTPQVIPGFPAIDNVSDISICDFLGTGTACIVYSSPLPLHAQQPLKYMDLMGSKKPHLLKGFKNNCGKEVTLEYISSTHFYLEDKKQGRPWITRLPFPVHVLAKKELYDKISQLRFATSYTYHHGYYDAVEKEFRGFGRVDQLDTETYEHFKRQDAANIVPEEFHQPPVLTKTWFHTGAYFNKEKIISYFRGQDGDHPEFFFNQQSEEYHLPEALLTDNKAMPLQQAEPGVFREAARACKSMMLRTETYALDGTDKEFFPYNVTERNCHIRLLQPHGDNQYAVFLVTEGESIAYDYERQPNDPRISHSLNIKLDEYGNIEQSVSVVYGREIVDAGLPSAITAGQKMMHVVLKELRYTNDVNIQNDHRLRVTAESLAYEVKGLAPSGKYFSAVDLTSQLAGITALPYDALFTAGQSQMRLIEHTRTVFANDTVSGALPLYQLQSKGFIKEKYQLAFTTGLLNRLYADTVNETMLLQAGYLRSAALKATGIFPGPDPDDNWWMPSGTVAYPADPAQHFFIPDHYIDPLGNISRMFYEPKYQLYIERTENALQYTTSVTRFDYRVMAPLELKDPNDNLTEIVFDTLGMVCGLALKGKGDQADDLVGFKADLTQTEIDQFMNDPLAQGATLLQHASCRFVYDLHQQPTVCASVNRETHHADTLQSGIPSILQYGFEYSNGLGQVLMKKIQAEPGEASFIDTDNSKKTVQATIRWVGNGRTILNNKGNAVKQYEPYFSATHRYEDDSRLVEIGVTPFLHYDPAGRNTRIDKPDGTFIKVEFDPWQQRTYDENDTVKDSSWFISRTTGELSGIAGEKEAAEKAAVHYDTPTVSVSDSLGRGTYSIAKNSFIDLSDNSVKKEEYASFISLDIENNQRFVSDARNNTIMSYDYDMLGNLGYSKSADAGENWVFNNIMGNTVQCWNSRQFVFRYEYDALNRPVKVFVRQGSNPEINAAKGIYGGNSAAEKQQNFCGELVEEYDEAGKVVSLTIDFKYNLLSSSRRLLKDYKSEPDWNTVNPATDFEAEEYLSSTIYNAVNLPLQMTTPDNSIIYSSFNEGGLLEKMEVQLRDTIVKKEFIKNINYNEKGQRESIVYGNDVFSKYTYDPNNFNLIRLFTTGNNGSTIFQDINYIFDAAGNITQMEDKAQQTHFFNNTVINPVCKYTYDAIYRVIQANGREHIGQQLTPQDNWNDMPRTKLPHRQDGNAMREYIQQFFYDSSGNISQLKHIANGGSYTRQYEYEALNNRLRKTTVGGDTYSYSYNEHGSFTAMPHLQQMDWNSKEELRRLDLGGGGQAWYVYNSQGQRIRKVVERSGGVRQETIYLGANEIYRQMVNGNEVILKRETLHLKDNTRRFAIIETRIIDANDPTGLHQPLTRYQFSNHLGSSSLELDDTSQIISYEEYHPFGTSSYQAIDKNTRAAIKRYRYTGKERDEESGLYYHGARYYISWLGRWTAADPIGVGDGLNLYCYVQNNPVIMNDPNGTKGKPDPNSPEEKQYQRNLAEARRRGFVRASPGANPSKSGRKTPIDSFRVKGSGKGTGGGGKKPDPPPAGGQPGGKKGGDPDGSGNKDQAGDPNGNADKNQAGSGNGEDGSTPPSNPQDNTNGGTEPTSETEEKISKAWHDLLMLAAVANTFSMPEDSPDGKADGIPGGRGSWGSKLGQALFVGLAAVGVAQLAKAAYSAVKALGSYAYRSIAAKLAADRIFKQGLKELTEAEVAQLGKTLATEVPDIAAGSAKNVNPGYPTAPGRNLNCANCSIATDATLRGSPATAATGVPTTPAQLQAALKEMGIAKTNWIPANGPKGIETLMSNWGPGSQAIIVAYPKTGMGHFFNVVNQGGVVRFIDGQVGRGASTGRYVSFHIIRTK